MRIIAEKDFVASIEECAVRANFQIAPHIEQLVASAYARETNPHARVVLDAIIKNLADARSKHLPICQDTGMVIAFIEIGCNAAIGTSGCRGIQELVDEGIQNAYMKHYLRKSVVSPLERKNYGTNTPAIVWPEIVTGERIKISLMIKGFGSENVTRLKLFRPSEDIVAISRFVRECVRKAGPNPCPPVFVGVGIGGTAEKALFLSKKALFSVGRQRNPETAGLEEKLLVSINKLGIGAGGLGGDTTCLDVRVETFPTHIAGLPVAVSIGCWAHRTAETSL
jgi:fumarate hydratase subunit alpha